MNTVKEICKLPSANLYYLPKVRMTQNRIADGSKLVKIYFSDHHLSKIHKKWRGLLQASKHKQSNSCLMVLRNESCGSIY